MLNIQFFLVSRLLYEITVPIVIKIPLVFYIIFGLLLAVLAFWITRKIIKTRHLDETIHTKTQEIIIDSIQQSDIIKKQTDIIAKNNQELQKMLLIVSHVQNSVIITNCKGEIEWVNEEFMRLYEISENKKQSIYGSTIENIHQTSLSMVMLREACNKRKPQSIAIKLTMTKKKEKWVQSIITPIINEENECTQIIIVESDITKLRRIEERLSKEKEYSESLLQKILPMEVAEELKLRGIITPKYYKSVSIMFADIISFSSICMKTTPQELLDDLNEYFNEFDEIVQNNHVEKIKTIGDAYMCACGIPTPNKTHAFNIVLSGLQFRSAINRINEIKMQQGRTAWQFRIGIHTGDIVSGVIGKHNYSYDIWGDTVNIASRMESTSDNDKINISETTYNIVKDFFNCTYRGKIETKNRGFFEMYFVDGIKPEFADPTNPILPNEKFVKSLKLMI